MSGDGVCTPANHEEDGDVDPRVKVELETLNFASTEINKLEREINMARNKFRSLLSNCSTRLNQLFKKLGKCVGKARPYYELLKQFKQAEGELTKATLQFQKANGLYQAAKETVALAEERMVTATKEDERPEFDSAWQEMMNHATLRFTESEKEKRLCEEQHQISAAKFSAIQLRLHYIEKDIPRSIKRAKPYFDLKDQLEGRLQAERQSVEDLQRALTAAKETYSESLGNLEAISEEIHAKRRLCGLPPRTPGVGAEAGSLEADTLNINLDTESISSEVFPDDCDVASLSSMDLLDSASPSPTDPLRSAFPPHSQPKPVCSPSPTDPLRSVLTPPSLVKSASGPSLRNMSTQGSDFSSRRGVFSREASPMKTIPVQTDPLSALQASASRNQPNHLPAVPTSEDTHSIYSQLKHSPIDNSVRNNAQNGFPLLVKDMPKATSTTNNEVESRGLSSSSPLKTNQDVNNCDSNLATTASKPETSRGRPKDRRVQKLNPSHFPILQGLSETNKRMSPKLPHGRPKGQEIVSHHSPSPVRKVNNTDYFIYPEPKLRQRGAIAREVSPGPNLFPESDTSLFEKKSRSVSRKESSVKGSIKSEAKSQVHSESENSRRSPDLQQTQPKSNSEESPNKQSHSLSKGDIGHFSIGRSDKNEGIERREVDGKEDLNTNQSNNAGIENPESADGMTEDGKVFYHV